MEKYVLLTLFLFIIPFPLAFGYFCFPTVILISVTDQIIVHTIDIILCGVVNYLC